MSLADSSCPLWTDELLINCARAAVPDGTTMFCANAVSKLRRVRNAREEAVEFGKRRVESLFILQVVQVGLFKIGLKTGKNDGKHASFTLLTLNGDGSIHP